VRDQLEASIVDALVSEADLIDDEAITAHIEAIDDPGSELLRLAKMPERIVAQWPSSTKRRSGDDHVLG
jgi:hypothetical protein